VWKQRPKSEVVELLEGPGAMLMMIDAHVVAIYEYLRSEDDEEEDDT
jgi:hypothetical protein